MVVVKYVKVVSLFTVTLITPKVNIIVIFMLVFPVDKQYLEQHHWHSVNNLNTAIIQFSLVQMG